jgi:hypothetical protein
MQNFWLFLFTGGKSPKFMIANLNTCTEEIFFHWLYSPLGPWPLIFQFHYHFYRR